MKFCLFCATVLCILSPLSANASIGGTYHSFFETGRGGGAVYSYVHGADNNPMTPTGGYAQYTGGPIFFGIRDDQMFTMDLVDNNAPGLSDGDILSCHLTVDLLEHDGSFNGTHTGPKVGEMTLSGSFEVGGAHSTHVNYGFTHGIRNITGAGNTSASGLSYTMNMTSGSGNFAVNDTLTGDGFFQAAELAGPFNGIKYDNGQITFAVWGNSWNTATNNTGLLWGAGQATPSSHSLGFDLFVNGFLVPEPTTFVSWGLLAAIGLGTCVLRRRRRAAGPPTKVVLPHHPDKALPPVANIFARE